MTNKLPISLVVITLNEEKNISRCLRSAPFVSDIVVLDSGSTDRTTEIAATLGARVFQESWRGFGPQKARATDLARHDWVLNLDADECVSEELAREIQEKFQQLNEAQGVQFSRRSFHLGRWVMHGGWYPDWQLRLYNRRRSHWSNSAIHEKVQSVEVIRWNKDLEHFVFRDLTHQVHTNNRYSGLQAEDHLRARGRFSLPRMLFKPLSKFIECYFLKLGFLDGMAGFIIAVGAAYSVFLRWAKIWEVAVLARSRQGEVGRKSI